MLIVIGHCVWMVLMMWAGHQGWGYWIPFVWAVIISYLNRKWHLTNGCTENRAIVLGSIFALTLCLPLYLLGTWIARMPGLSD